MSLKQPYLLFLGDAPDALSAKVAQGIKDWRPGVSVGQLRLPGCQADMGLDDMTVAEATGAGAKTLVIGVANRGGYISDAWKAVLIEAMEAGMDIAAGLHTLLNKQPDLAEAAARTGRILHDVRIPTVQYPIGDGKKRAGKRLLAVGTDCSCGKMYTALAMEKAMLARGMKASFRATGQTGILITGDGVPLDAVIADFMAGAVEHLTPDNEADHWDLIEGQGSLFHPSLFGSDDGARAWRSGGCACPLPRTDADAHAGSPALLRADPRGIAGHRAAARAAGKSGCPRDRMLDQTRQHSRPKRRRPISQRPKPE